MAGLPRSGKSTWASKQGYPIVNRDSIRYALYKQAFVAEAEEMISAIEMLMVRALFFAGHHIVIVDACNMTEKRRTRWYTPLWDTQLKVISTSKTECLKRATPELIPVIERMASETDLNISI